MRSEEGAGSGERGAGSGERGAGSSGKLPDKANEIAKKIASKPPMALRMTKRLIRNAQYATPDHAMQDAAAVQSLCHYTEDHIEALSAMFEKRKPQFLKG